MAIDDNEDYTLTGAQVKDLAAKVKSGGTPYTAGNGIDIDANNEISIDDTVVAELSDLPTRTSDLQNDGSGGTSTYVEADDLATVATSGLYSDLTGTPTIPAAQIQSDWTQTTTTALDYIKNKPEIRHVNSVSDAGWSADANKLVDGSVLAYWNGAYSGTASNLKYFANSSVTTANLQNDCVTASKLYDRNTANTTDTWMLVLNGDKIQHRVVKAFNSDGSIPKSAMHGLPCPDYSTVITAWGTINSTTTKTTSADGYIIGKAIVNGTDKQALVEIGGKQVAGIPYNATSQINNLQVAFCIPVKSGTSVKFQCSGGTGGFFQGCNLIGWKM